MGIFVIDPNTKLSAVYYNRGKPPHLFRMGTNVTLFGLKEQLDQINRQLNHRDTRRMDSVEYQRPSIESIELSGSSR